MLDPITSRLSQSLDLLSARQKLVATNLANIDTPGYKTRDIDFQFEFASALDSQQPNVIEPQGLPVKNDGNNVSLERETRLLSENALRFNFTSNLLRNELKTVHDAINGGGTSA